MTDLQKWEQILKRNGWTFHKAESYPLPGKFIDGQYHLYIGSHWVNPEGKRIFDFVLPTLDNLFEIGVKGLRNLPEDDNTLQDVEFHYQGVNISDRVTCCLVLDDLEFDGEGDTPAQALLEALHKAMVVNE